MFIFLKIALLFVVYKLQREICDEYFLVNDNALFEAWLIKNVTGPEFQKSVILNVTELEF